MTVTITPLTPGFAGEVGPIDLRKVRDRETLEAIRAGMDKYAVLVFRDQDFTNDEQLDFAQRFDGTLHARTSSAAISGNRFGNEALADVSNVGADGKIRSADDRKRASAHEESFRRAVKAGVKIAFGTDMGGIPWTEPIAQEFPRMVEFGMSPMQAIVSATSIAARVMKIDGAGSLQTGKWADLVVLNANPLMDIKNTRQIDSVYIGGRKVNMAAVSGTN